MYGGGKRRKKYDYDFRRKNNVCLSVYTSLQSRFGERILSHPHSKRNERKENLDILTFLSSFVTSFYSSVYVHLFAVHLFPCTQAAATYLLLQTTAIVIQTHLNRGLYGLAIKCTFTSYNPSSITRCSTPLQMNMSAI